MLLPNKDRKQAFEDYIRLRADEERKERRDKIRKQKEDFQQLLDDAKLTTKYVILRTISMKLSSILLCKQYFYLILLFYV